MRDLGKGSASLGTLPGADADQTTLEAKRTTASPARSTSSNLPAKKAVAPIKDEPGKKARTMLRARLGDDIYSSWFMAIEFGDLTDGVLQVSVPVKFLCSWIQSHYADDLLACCQAEFVGTQRVDVVLRQPIASKASLAAAAPSEPTPSHDDGHSSARQLAAPGVMQSFAQPIARNTVGGFQSSPLDPRMTLEQFVVGSSNRMAHAGATQVAEMATSGTLAFNPLYLYSSVGLGKTHLMHAIAWDVKRRSPNANVLYLTVERFRYQFVDALRSSDPMSFKEKFRNIDVLLIDDLEFIHGEKTEQEFDHIINAMIDGCRQIVVASARAPRHIERLNERMRSRLQGGLVCEIGALDQDLRRQVLEKRLEERRAGDPSFTVAPQILDMLAERLTENGRELEGAMTRLYANWNLMKTPISPDIAETIIRDLVQGIEPHRTKIEDIMRVIARHFGVSKSDLLSQRRHRSVVHPRQIGMYLSKKLTQRSLPEIGRRFGNRDHTTVLHAVRKIESKITEDARLRDEVEELKKLLSH